RRILRVDDERPGVAWARAGTGTAWAPGSPSVNALENATASCPDIKGHRGPGVDSNRLDRVPVPVPVLQGVPTAAPVGAFVEITTAAARVQGRGCLRVDSDGQNLETLQVGC